MLLFVVLIPILLLVIHTVHVYIVLVEVDEYVIKAQILAGGRGKGVFSNGFKGGVHLTKK